MTTYSGFSNYFKNVSLDVQLSMKLFNFFKYVSQINMNKLFISPTHNIEILNVASSLNPNKAIEPNNISSKTMQTSKQKYFQSIKKLL